MRRKIIAVVGAGTAEEVGRLIALRGALLVCGGLSGVMEAAARGARESGGTTVGILPQHHCNDANPYIDVPVATGFGEGRNVVLVRTADALIAVGGEYGTLSEISFALKAGKTVVGIDTWDIEGVIKADSAEEAVRKAFAPLHGT
ncbi:MAG: TIGR00725 family protein [Thermodesulfovibrionales bacterium]